MLAAVYGLEKFHHYTHGWKVNVFTDHKPLVSICQKPLAKAPKRLQNLLLRAQQYDFSIKYKPGKEIPLADALSRAPTDKTEAEELMIVNNLTMHPIKDRRLSETRSKTLEDPIMKILAEVITIGLPSDKRLLPHALKPFFDYRSELTAQDGQILRGQRIVIPHAMRPEMKQRSHVGHLGINSCLRRVRDLIFWPGISAEIRQYVQACATCATYADRQPAEPFIITEVPKKPWQRVAADNFSWGGSEYLVSGSAQQFFWGWQAEQLNLRCSDQPSKRPFRQVWGTRHSRLRQRTPNSYLMHSENSQEIERSHIKRYPQTTVKQTVL